MSIAAGQGQGGKEKKDGDDKKKKHEACRTSRTHVGT